MQSHDPFHLRRTHLAVAVSVAALTFGACGGDDDASDDDANTAPTDAAEAQDPATEAATDTTVAGQVDAPSAATAARAAAEFDSACVFDLEDMAAVSAVSWEVITDEAHECKYTASDGTDVYVNLRAAGDESIARIDAEFGCPTDFTELDELPGGYSCTRNGPMLGALVGTTAVDVTVLDSPHATEEVHSAVVALLQSLVAG